MLRSVSWHLRLGTSDASAGLPSCERQNNSPSAVYSLCFLSKLVDGLNFLSSLHRGRATKRTGGPSCDRLAEVRSLFARTLSIRSKCALRPELTVAHNPNAAVATAAMKKRKLANLNATRLRPPLMIPRFQRDWHTSGVSCTFSALYLS